MNGLAAGGGETGEKINVLAFYTSCLGFKALNLEEIFEMCLLTTGGNQS